jgi:diacylglycerol kinase family enzyme
MSRWLAIVNPAAGAFRDKKFKSKWLPEASISDGQFDALEPRAGWARQPAHNLSVLSHTYLVGAGEEFCARTVHVSFPTPQLLMADGELFENVVDLRVVTRPGALTVQRFRIKTC